MTETVVISLLIIIPGLIAITKNILNDLYFWQIKEFRWDRFWTHIRWDFDKENQSPYITGIKFVIFGLASLMFVVPAASVLAILLALTVWWFESLETLQAILQKKLVRPALKNPRNLLIILILLLIILLAVFFVAAPFLQIDRDGESGSDAGEILSLSLDSASDITYPDIYILLSLLTVLLLLIDLATPVLVAVFVGLTSPIAKLRREMTIRKAEKKLKNHSEIKLVAITGSQGKTTTKEILYELVKDSFKTVKTPENYNTDFGVASAVLSEIKKDTEVFIAEMGAYRTGELKKAVTHFPPDISVVTNMEYQHIGLFGSRKKLFEAKSELIRYQKQDGVAVINLDDEFGERLAKINSNRKIYISKINKNIEKIASEKDSSFTFSNVEQKSDTLSFELNNKKITVPQKGEHLVTNIILAFAVATELGIDEEVLIKRLEKLSFKLPRLSVETGDNGTVILDDSYNSSFSGFEAAVQLLDKVTPRAKGKRIVVTNGIKELGEHKGKLYKQLVEIIREKIDILVTSDSILAKEFMHENDTTTVYLEKTKDDMLYILRKIIEPGDIILLEGRLHSQIIKELVSDRA